MPSWAIIEYDPNQGRIFDIVTNDHAEGINVGDEVIAVVAEHVMRPSSEGAMYTAFNALDYGHATLCRVTSKRATRDKMTLIYAEPVDG